MAFTVTINESYVEGNHKVRSGTLAFDASYATGGEAITAAEVGLSQITSMQIQAFGGFVYNYVPDTSGTGSVSGKIMAYWTGSTTSGAFAQVTNTGNMSSAANAVPFIARGH